MTGKPAKPKTEGRDVKGRFKKGFSGNPGGARRTGLYEAVATFTQENSDLIIGKIMEKIESGDPQIITQLLRHSLPKGRLTKINLSETDPAKSILNAVADGKLSADEGQAMARIVDLVDHEKRLRNLEERLKEAEN